MNAPATPSHARRLLRDFAKRRSRILLARGLAAAALVLVAALLLVAFADRRFLLAPPLRVALSATAYAASLVAFLLAGGGRWLLATVRPESEVEASRMLRSRQPAGSDLLRSAVELRESGNGSEAFIAQVERDADADAGRVRVEQVLPGRLYAWRAAAACSVVAALVAAIVLPSLRHWQVGRMVGRALLPAADIPRASPWNVSLADTPPFVPLREDIVISAEVEALFGGEPETVELEVSPDVGRARRVEMMRGDDGRYVATLQLEGPATLRAWADRGTSPSRRIGAAARPAVVAVEGEFHPPAYLINAEPVAITGGTLEALEGSRAEVALVFSEPVAAARLATADGVAIEAEIDSSDPRRARWTLPVDAAGTFAIAASSIRTGLATADREPLTVRPVADRPPTIATQALDDAALTPASVALFSAEASDDVALAFSLPEWRIGNGPWIAPEATAVSAAAHAESWPIDLQTLGARAGDLLEVRLRAVDAKGQEAVGEPVRQAIMSGGLPRELLEYLQATRDLADAAGSEGAFAAALTAVAAAPSNRAAFESAAAAEGAALAAPPPSFAAFVAELRRAEEVAAAAALYAAAAGEAAAVAEAAANFSLERLALTRAQRRQAGAVALAAQAEAHAAFASDGLPTNTQVRRRLDRAASQAARAADRLYDDNRLLSASDAQRFARDLEAAQREADRALAEAQQRLDDVRDALDAEVADALLAALASGGEAAPFDALATIALRRPDAARAAPAEVDDLVLLRRVAREWPRLDDATTPSARDAVATVLAARRLAHLRSLEGDQRGDRDARAFANAADRLAGALLLTELPSNVSSSVRRAGRDAARADELLREASDAAQPALDAARALLRSLLPSVVDAAADAAAADDAEWPEAAERLADALRDDANRQSVEDADARERARDADAALAALNEAATADDGRQAAEQIEQHFRDPEAGRDVADTRRELREGELDAAADEHERLRRLAEAADANAADAADQMRAEAASDPAVRDAVEQSAAAAERDAATALSEAAANEAAIAEDLAEVADRLRDARERGEAGDPVAIEEARQALERLRRRVGQSVRASEAEVDQQATVAAAEALKEAAGALADPESPDPATAAGAVERAAGEMVKAVQASATQAEQAAERAGEKGREASDALESGGDYVTPYRAYEQAKREAEDASARAAASAEAARQADALAKQLAEESSRPAAAEKAAQQRQAQAAQEQQAVREQAESAAKQLEQAADARRELGQNDAADSAEAAAQQARRAADGEVAAAQSAAATGSPAEAAAAAQAAASAMQQAAVQAGSAAASGGPPKPDNSPGSPSEAVAEAMSQMAQGDAEGAARSMRQAAQRQANQMQRERSATSGGPPQPSPSSGEMAQGGQPSPSPSPGGEPAGNDAGGVARGVGQLGERPQDRGGDWAKLGGRDAADVAQGRRPGVPSEYAESVEAYYRALAERAKQRREQP